MDTQPNDAQAVVQTPEIDPLRRVWVPIEKRTSDGRLVFRTSDGDVYERQEDGSIRRARLKVSGKQMRKERARARRR